MLARIVTTGALYEKTLELKLKTIGELSIGKIVNLASNDVQRLDIVSQCLYAQTPISLRPLPPRFLRL